MAGSGEERDRSLICWTFVFRGGSSFSLALSGPLGPGHDHDGRLTIWKFVGTKEQALEVEKEILREVPGLRIDKHTEVEDDEMLAIRHERLGRNLLED